MLRICAGIILVVLHYGCVWNVTPPEAVADPEGVFVTVYGRHTRLALPDAERGSLIEYGFGDWHFYALGETTIKRGLRALFSSEASAYSRRVLPMFADADRFMRAAGGSRSERITVEREAVEDLRERLERRWRELDGERAFRESEQLTLVRADDSYHLFRNSNHMTADWLRELGATVDGATILSRFRVRETARTP